MLLDVVPSPRCGRPWADINGGSLHVWSIPAAVEIFGPTRPTLNRPAPQPQLRPLQRNNISGHLPHVPFTHFLRQHHDLPNLSPASRWGCSPADRRPSAVANPRTPPNINHHRCPDNTNTNNPLLHHHPLASQCRPCRRRRSNRHNQLRRHTTQPDPSHRLRGQQGPATAGAATTTAPLLLPRRHCAHRTQLLQGQI
jgi:hypothetical protein